MTRHGVRAASSWRAAAATVTGCGAQIPTDPNGTLDCVTGGELRVGAVVEPGLVEVIDGEESLVTRLEEGTLDLAVGGFTVGTPWIDRAGVTRGYPGIPGTDGRELVMLVPLGENAMLSELEVYLDGEVGS